MQSGASVYKSYDFELHFAIDQFHHDFHNSAFFNLRFGDIRIAPFKMEISPIALECHWKT